MSKGFPLLFVLLLLAASASAQSGKLSGRVVDDRGEPLPGATVFLLGTTLGAAADLNGEYGVIQIPPGTYSVRYSIIGFQTKVVEGVLITSNNTTTINVELGEEVLQGGEVVVTAERPIVDVSLTSSMSTLSKDDIDVLPVQELADIVNLQAGVVDGHFRGGRTGEVQWQVDGISVNNPYDNSSSLKLDRSVLQEVQVISGTFDAEYGQAMSGVVNAVLRSGDTEQYSISAEVFSGDYFSPGNDSTTVRDFFGDVSNVALFPNIGSISPATRQNYQFSVSGPVPVARNTTFLFNGQRQIDDGYLTGVRRFLPTDSSNFETRVFNASGDGALVSMSSRKEWSGLAKIANRSIKNFLIEYQAIANQIESSGYSHGFRFNPDGNNSTRRFSIVHGLDVTHTLSSNTFYELGLRQNYFDSKSMKYDDVRDPRYFEAGPPRGDSNFLEGAFVQGLDLGRFVQTTNQFVAKGAVTSQASKVHLLKIGGELQIADLKFGTPGRLEQGIVDGFQQLVVVEDTLNARVLNYNPVFAALFVQDRIEWKDLRIRAGIRMEVFDANSTIPTDLANPANSIEGAPESRPKATTTKMVFAPRLGVSFPVLEGASVYFSYGHFYQMPGLGTMFSNSDYSILEDLQAGAVSYGTLGNPDLKPEFTTQYEFGLKTEVGDFMGADVSLFYKDIRDLLGVEFIQTYTAADYSRLTNVDFGGVRGFTIALDQRGPGIVSSSLDYSYQVAIGNSSDPNETARRAEAGDDPRPRQVPLNWDQRHTLNGTLGLFERSNYSVTGIFRLASGQPYTPSIGTTFGADLEANSGRKPAYLTVDLRAEKFFKLGGMEWTGFLRVFNLFDQHYANGFVYSDTGSPYFTLIPAQQRNPNPARLNAPRRIEIGASIRGLIQRR